MEFIEIKGFYKLSYSFIHTHTHINKNIYIIKLYSTEHELESCGE
jgi:hypothetical protein